ncbi:MAG: hypothetical protein HRU09_10650 [Oligoflexales bacterium]|nr:hypothetical protein [Oligoflexales bacterium]
MSKIKQPFDRRAFLRKSILGGVGTSFALEQLLAIRLYGDLIARKALMPMQSTLDSYPLMQNALKGGASLLNVHKAMAQSTSEWSVVTIKIVNHVCTPLLFRLGEVSGDTTVQGPGSIDLSTRVKNAECGAMLASKGINLLSDIDRFRNLRFNKWFADMLRFGTQDGLAYSAAANNSLVDPSLIGEFPADSQVAIQCGLGLSQGVSGNHSLANMKLSNTMPDLAKFILDTGIVYSPLGITCFNMGDEYDQAEGATPFNIVCSGDGEAAAVVGRSVKNYFDGIKQNVSGTGYSVSSTEDNLTLAIDQLVTQDPVLRKELLASRANFVTALSELESAANLETEVQTYDTAQANFQTNMSGAGKEFLAQCAYVAKAMNIPGQPVRNFSLFLNTIDLDRNPIDFDAANGGNTSVIRALTYVEGMRQLAVGLNVLAQSIAAGNKLIVQVISEGGRSNDLADSKNSFGIVLGPAGVGNLSDVLYANAAEINNGNSLSVVNPAAPEANTVWDSNYLKKPDGSAVDDAELIGPSVANLQMGVAEFLAEKNQASTAINDAGINFIKLKRGE